MSFVFWMPAFSYAMDNKKQWLSLHQGPTHRLEINTPKDGLNMNDLSTDEEEHVHGQMKNYEKKIENLMSEMGSLKTEVGIVRNHWKLNQSHISCILIMWPPTPHNHHQQCKKRKNPKHPPPPTSTTKPPLPTSQIKKNKILKCKTNK